MSVLLSIWNAVKLPFALVIGVLGTIAVVLRRAREDGKNELRAEQQEKRDELQSQYKEIDRRPADFNAAAERMRDRAAKRRG